MIRPRPCRTFMDSHAVTRTVPTIGMRCNAQGSDGQGRLAEASEAGVRDGSAQSVDDLRESSVGICDS